jgi:hypothetical protein
MTEDELKTRNEHIKATNKAEADPIVAVILNAKTKPELHRLLATLELMRPSLRKQVKRRLTAHMAKTKKASL